MVNSDANLIPDLEQRLRGAKLRFENAREAMLPKHKGGEWEEWQAAYQELMAAERQLAAAKNEEHVIPLDFPVLWDSGAPLPHLLTNDHRTFLTFFVRRADPNWDGTYTTLVRPSDPSPRTIAVVEFKRCLAARMGSPNDEVFHGHLLSGKGLEAYTAQQVVNSRWVAELEAINRVHSCYKSDHWKDVNHYVLWFHDSTFECVASSFEVQIYDKSLSEILASVCEKLVR
jgi:hypothetical protein